MTPTTRPPARRSPLAHPAPTQAGRSALRTALIDGLSLSSLLIGFGSGCLSGALIIVLYVQVGIPTGWAAAGLAVAGLGLIVFSFHRMSRFAHFAAGARGEQEAGSFFDQLPRHGWQVLHDVRPPESDGWNIDHVLIGPHGVFAVETKHWTKPADQDARLIWNGQRLDMLHRKTGQQFPAPHGPAAIEQAERNASTIRAWLERETARRWQVQPVLVFPGWFIEDNSGGKGCARVTNPKLMVQQLGSVGDKAACLSAADIALARARLGYVQPTMA